jgi:hypothetical protein
MKRALSAVSLILFTVGMLPAAGQVNPYKEGTPGVTGYRSEIMAEVMVQEDKFTRAGRSHSGGKISVAAGGRCALICRSLSSCQRGELQPL